jgi:vacuolar-type H+-ATPase subunit I/STV1
MTRKLNSPKNAQADRQRHQKNVQASEARKRETGLACIAIWVPLDHADAFKKAAKRAVDQHMHPVSTDHEKSLIPKLWRNPRPAVDRRQEILPR